MSKEISLQNGMKAIVDDDDFERTSQYLWHARMLNGRYLYVSTHFRVDGIKKEVSLNQFILNIKPETSHCIIFENNNRLDFRKSNLKIVHRSFAQQRSGGRKNSTSKYKGVHWKAKHKKWVAQIHTVDQAIHLGLYESEEEAALVYNEAALFYYGEHAYQNAIFKSKYRGVSKTKAKGKWIAKIKNRHIGVFDTEEEAAMAYNVIASEIYGEKAILNEIH